jgi:hypothetical protein
MVNVTFQFSKVTSFSLDVCLLLVEIYIIESKAELQRWALYCHSVPIVLVVTQSVLKKILISSQPKPPNRQSERLWCWVFVHECKTCCWYYCFRVAVDTFVFLYLKMYFTVLTLHKFVWFTKWQQYCEYFKGVSVDGFSLRTCERI